jgi:hypothetical protein
MWRVICCGAWLIPGVVRFPIKEVMRSLPSALDCQLRFKINLVLNSSEFTRLFKPCKESYTVYLALLKYFNYS